MLNSGLTAYKGFGLTFSRPTKQPDTDTLITLSVAKTFITLSQNLYNPFGYRKKETVAPIRLYTPIWSGMHKRTEPARSGLRPC